MEPAAPTLSKSSGVSRCSAVNSGVEEPPGVQNLSSCPPRTPPAMSSSSRSVMPSGASYWPGRVTCPDRLKKPKPVDRSVPHGGEPVRTVQHDGRHGGDGLPVVDHRGTGVEAGDRGERRLQPRLPAPALQRVQQRRLLAADVRARAGMNGDLEVEAGTEDVLAQVALGVGLLDRPHQPPVDVDDLPAKVDERVVAADRVRRDRDSLDQELRRREHQRDVLAGARLGLVRVHHEVTRSAVRLGQEAPLHAGREAGAAPAAEPGVLHQLDQVGLRRVEGLAQRPVAVVPLVGRHRPAALVVPERAEDRGEGCHAQSSFWCAASARASSPDWSFRPPLTPASCALGELGAAACSAATCSTGASSPPSRESGRGALQSLRRARFRPSSEAAPAPTPSSARPSENPASVRDTCLNVQTRDGPRDGRTGRPARRSSTTPRALAGVRLSKNSQFTIITGAKSQAALHSSRSSVILPSSVVSSWPMSRCSESASYTASPPMIAQSVLVQTPTVYSPFGCRLNCV